MNKAPLLFLGFFFAIAFSWTGIILSNQISYGHLQPYKDPTDEQLYPLAVPGIAERGKLVYQDLGCIYCHSQQVRQPGFGSDNERGWGDRGSVARDYIRQQRVLLGTMRTGPDLMNIGARQPNSDWHYKHLYDPQITSKGSVMPPFTFLFEKRKIIGQPSTKAILLPAAYSPEPGYEIVPTPRAEALVAYLQSLKSDYTYPEAKPHPRPKAEGEEKGKAPENKPAGTVEPKKEGETKK